jgi:hypothetical protein
MGKDMVLQVADAVYQGNASKDASQKIMQDRLDSWVQYVSTSGAIQVR